MNDSDIWRKVGRLVIAGVLGYGLIVALTTAGFNGWLQGADLYGGGAALRAKGALVALVAGLAGGCLAALIGRHRPLLHAVAVLPLLIADTIYVLFFFGGSAPFWFELVASLGLMTSTVAGGVIVWAMQRRRPLRPSGDTL